MKHTIHTLIQEFKDLFSESTSEKKIFDILKDLQILRKNFAPKKEFKENLKSRLEGIYSIGQEGGISRFSFFQYISMLTSFIFISGVGYIVYDTYQTSPQNIMLEQILTEYDIEENTLKILPTSQEIKDQILKKSQEEKAKRQPQEVIGKDENMSIKKSVQEMKSTQTKTSGAILIPESVGALKSSTDKIEDTSSFIVEEKEMKDIQKNPIEPSSSMMLESMIQNDIYDNTTQGESISPVNQIAGDNFLQICKKYNGKLSSSGDECTLKNGEICYPDTIETCILTLSGSINTLGNDNEIFLQELLEEFGQ